MSGKLYKIRYFIEDWNKPIPPEEKKKTVKVMPGVSVSGSNLGYADALFIASIVRDDDGKASVLLLDSDSQSGRPSKEMLVDIRDQIDHQLKHHCN